MTRKLLLVAFLLTLVLTGIAMRHQLTNAAPSMAPPKYTLPIQSRVMPAKPQGQAVASGDFFFPPYPSVSHRMGIAAGSIGLYNLALQAGWYYDWNANPNPPRPGGMEYARLIGFTVNTNACGLYKIPASQRSQVVESITGTALIDNLMNFDNQNR